MLKERLSDLLGEPCLFASVVPLPGFSLALRPWVRGMVSIVPSPPICSQLHSTGPWGKGSVKTVEILHDTELVFRTWTTSPIALQHCTTLEGAHWCVACVNSVKDHLKQACYGRAWRSQQQVLPLSHSYNGITPSLRTPLRGGRRREERRWDCALQVQ